VQRLVRHADMVLYDVHPEHARAPGSEKLHLNRGQYTFPYSVIPFALQAALMYNAALA
jgi:hypothetical protein